MKEDQDELSIESVKNPRKDYDVAKAPFSWEKLDGLLAHKSTAMMCEELLDCPASTIKDHIRYRYGLTFTEYADKKLSVTKLKLVQKAIQMAMNGNVVMTIFCLKNINKWQDKFETEIDINMNKIELSYKVER